MNNCNIIISCAINLATMVAPQGALWSAMAKKVHKLSENDDLVLNARTEADALGQLYEIYYQWVLLSCFC